MKRLSKLFLIMFLTLSLFTLSTKAVYGISYIDKPKITTKRAIMEWKYKIENGNVYRWLWDSQKNEWASKWIKIN